MSETGPVHEGEAIPALAASQSVVARMLALAPGQVSDPIPIPSGQVVVQVTATTPAVPKPLATVRTQIAKDLGEERARASVAEASRSVTAKGGGLKALAALPKTDLKTQADLQRGSAPPGVPADPAILAQIGTISPGAIGEPVTTPSGIVVLSVRERKDQREEFASQRDATRDALVRQRQDRLYRALTKRLKDEARIEINDPLVRALDQG